LQAAVKASQRVRGAALDGAERDAGAFGDLAQSEALEVREADDLAVLGGEPLERGADLPPEQGPLERVVDGAAVLLMFGVDGEGRAD
jgi:hypothetical protein